MPQSSFAVMCIAEKNASMQQTKPDRRAYEQVGYKEIFCLKECQSLADLGLTMLLGGGLQQCAVVMIFSVCFEHARHALLNFNHGGPQNALVCNGKTNL